MFWAVRSSLAQLVYYTFIDISFSVTECNGMQFYTSFFTSGVCERELQIHIMYISPSPDATLSIMNGITIHLVQILSLNISMLAQC